MKKTALPLLLTLALLPYSVAAMTLDLPLVHSNVSGSGTYGGLRLVDMAGGNCVAVFANYDDDVFTPTDGSFGVQDVYLNLADTYTGPVAFSQDGSQNNGETTWSLQQGSIQADGFGSFTLNATSGSNAADLRIPITAAEGWTELFTLTGTGLDVSDFLAYSKDKRGNDTDWMAAIHLAGYTDDSGETSSYLAATPIPGTAYLLGSGVAGLVGIARWRRRRK